MRAFAVHVKAHRRLDKVNFPESVRQAVAAKYGEDQVSLAGVFILKQGKAKLHIMPDFPDAFKSEAEVSFELVKMTIRKNNRRNFTLRRPFAC